VTSLTLGKPSIECADLARDANLSSGRASTPELWAVVLAGGRGIRLRPLTRLICGDDRPKQYVTLTGTRSLLQQTLERAALRIPSDRTVVVSVEAQATHLATAIQRGAPHVLLQPEDRGTAAGVLLPAHWIDARAPDATVVFMPSDHLVLEEHRFMDQVVQAAAFVDENPERIVLLGAQATEPETEYGWIEPGSLLGRSGHLPVWAVRRFIEKPSLDVARACLAAGASWNTFVFVAKARALVNAGRDAVPRIHHALHGMMHASGRRARPDAIRRVGGALPSANFSRDVLERVAPRLAVTTLADVTWCDWGSPRRVIASLTRMGLRPPWLDQLTEPAGPGSER
jgi:mannose-1-phosphate guanylyltransferase